MKTFEFVESNGSAVVILSATDYEEAVEYMKDLGLSVGQFRCEDEEGEDEDE